MKFTGERRARRIVTGRSGGFCEVCDRLQATEWHHRKNRSQGGAWCPSNGLHVCSPCHRHITTHPFAAREQGWAVGHTENPERIPVWLGRHGRVLLSKAGDVTPVEQEPWSW